MATVKGAAQLSTDELLQAVSRLSPAEFEQFAARLRALEAQRKAPSLPRAEAELLLQINQGVAPEVQERYDALIAKRRAESLTPDEHDELLRLTDQMENLEARRLEHLAELARLRQTSLPALMKTLGIRTPAYG